ncbi:M20 family metallopeptidase [Paenibacillus sp. J5C_2022]|uniref:M20 metallopeptidase family protein n=1 Tax=Paenibacillus sp. J5C2022 TaxID=2977129 RepID=UPI0021D35670|nr:M20 family metallopeptidase [Paenibacillus sp. J5C2022]MCU6707585.1 M20 family metallopeptidase [Paenibacillus sp. J5C2022]
MIVKENSVSLKELLWHSANALEAELTEHRRHLHAHPELSLEEGETAEYVASCLRQLGLETRTGIGGHGVVADIEGGRPGSAIALRADMDALPIHEETGLAFSSRQPGKMHACGHDAHTAILLGAAKLLVQHKEHIAGRVRLLFQPAEEIVTGAQAMLEEGVLNGVDQIYGLHNLPTLPAGKVATAAGPLMGSVDRIELTVHGKGAHGAMPEQGADPIVASAAIIGSLQTISSRELSPFSPVIVTFGSIHAGEANNVIPPLAELTGTVRTFDPEVRATMKERLTRIVESVAEAHRCLAELRFIEQNPVLVNDSGCNRYAEDTLDWLLGADKRTAAAPTLAGEDFARFVEKIPGCFFWLGSGPQEGAEQAYGLHHPKFNLNEDCLVPGAAAMAALVLHGGHAEN